MARPDSGADGRPPLISAFDPPCDGASRGPTPGVDGSDDLHRFTLSDYPDAVCNDGTPAVFFIRRAASTASEGDWLFHLQGGSHCDSYETCRARWCGADSPYHAGKMSSRWTPESMGASEGILQRGAANPIADANEVFLYYCSSDTHSGQRSDVVYTSASDPSQQLRVHHRGHDIVTAMMTQLLAGPTMSDDGHETVPSIAGASRVLVTGTSAGSGAVVVNVDYIAERLGRDTETIAVMDAALDPDQSTIDDPTTLAVVEVRYDWEVEQARLAPFVDDSCVAAHASDPGSCLDRTHVRLNHLTSPSFARMDLADPVVTGGLRAISPTLDPLTQPRWIRETLLLLAEVQTTAEEPIPRRPGVYGPGCMQHVGLTSGAWYDEAAIDDPAGTPWTLRQALEAWLEGADVVLVDTVPPSLSTCAEPTGARS